MKIVVNCSWRGQRITGQQRYAQEISRRLMQEPGVVARPSAGHHSRVGAWLGAQALALPRSRGERLLTLTSRGPLWHPRHVVTIHDHFVLTNPEWFSRKYVATHAPLLRAQVAGARGLVFVSAATQDRHHELFGDKVPWTTLGHEVEVWGGRSVSMRALLDDEVVHRPAAMTSLAIIRALAAARPDVLHAHMTKAETAGVLPRLIRSVPLVATRHFAATRGSGRRGRLAGAVISGTLDAQIAISDYVSRSVDGPSTVVYPGVEVSPIEEVERRPVVLVVQRLQPEKDTGVALHTFAAGAPAGWSLEVVGQGPQLTELRELAARLGIARRTTFLGFRDDVAQLMRSSSVLIAPCEIEGLGLSVLEAMSQGLPVLASDAGAHPETVGRAPDARLFPPGDPTQAGAMLSELCEDSGLRERYGEQLRAVQRTTFTPEAQAQATEAVYGTVRA